MKQKILLGICMLLLVFGVALILYPTISSLINSLNASQVIDGYNDVVEEMTEEEISSFKQAAHSYNERLLSSSVVMTDPFDIEATRYALQGYNEVLNIDGSGLMAYLDIPVINVHLPIYHGTSQEVLKRSVGHLEGTSVPIGGESTHSVLSAHTGLTEAKLFTDLDELVVGDTFSITVLDEILTYQVYDIEIVEPDEISSLRIEEGKDLCTLVTCTPYGINTHRLLVHGTRIPTSDAIDEASAISLNFNALYVLAGIVVVIAALATLRSLLKKRVQRQQNIQKLWREIVGLWKTN